MIKASKEITDENLSIFYNTELNKIIEKDENDNLKTRAEMDVKRFKEYDEESKITRKEI